MQEWLALHTAAGIPRVCRGGLHRNDSQPHRIALSLCRSRIITVFRLSEKPVTTGSIGTGTYSSVRFSESCTVNSDDEEKYGRGFPHQLLKHPLLLIGLRTSWESRASMKCTDRDADALHESGVPATGHVLQCGDNAIRIMLTKRRQRSLCDVKLNQAHVHERASLFNRERTARAYRRRIRHSDFRFTTTTVISSA